MIFFGIFYIFVCFVFLCLLAWYFLYHFEDVMLKALPSTDRVQLAAIQSSAKLYNDFRYIGILVPIVAIQQDKRYCHNYGVNAGTE